MFQLEKFLRPNIAALKPYSSARSEFTGSEGVFLDANENPFGIYNRYPDPYQQELKVKIAELKKVDSENIFIGNGSDEVIDLALRLFCTPSKDKIIICSPTYGMYKVLAHINDVEVINIPLNADFQIDVENVMLAQENITDIKIIFLCSPNNPTGNTLQNIDFIIENFKGIVFIDEAYIDFSTQQSLLSKIKQFPNIIVSQTLSKAWGSAALRIGIAYASKIIIDHYNKIKSPYNISKVNQQLAVKILDDINHFHEQVADILNQKKCLLQELHEFDFIKKIYPSDANFILIEVTDANALYQYLLANEIIVRNRHTIIENCIRITIGNQIENTKLLNALKNYKQ